MLGFLLQRNRAFERVGEAGAGAVAGDRGDVARAAGVDVDAAHHDEIIRVRERVRPLDSIVGPVGACGWLLAFLDAFAHRVEVGLAGLTW